VGLQRRVAARVLPKRQTLAMNDTDREWLGQANILPWWLGLIWGAAGAAAAATSQPHMVAFRILETIVGALGFFSAGMNLAARLVAQGRTDRLLWMVNLRTWQRYRTRPPASNGSG